MEANAVCNPDGYSTLVSIVINGTEYQYSGRYYGQLLDTDGWQFGLCPVCGNVSGRTSIGASDYCFCLEHMISWSVGWNIFGDHKTSWFTEEVQERNRVFLKLFKIAVNGLD